MTKINKITKDTLIGEAISINPKATEIMFEYGLHCIGCGGAAMETIEIGAKAHGISDEKIEEMVQKIMIKKANGLKIKSKETKHLKRSK